MESFCFIERELCKKAMKGVRGRMRLPGVTPEVVVVRSRGSSLLDLVKEHIEVSSQAGHEGKRFVVRDNQLQYGVQQQADTVLRESVTVFKAALSGLRNLRQVLNQAQR